MQEFTQQQQQAAQKVAKAADKADGHQFINPVSQKQKADHSLIHSLLQSLSTQPASHWIPGGGNCPLFDMRSKKERDKIREGLM